MDDQGRRLAEIALGAQQIKERLVSEYGVGTDITPFLELHRDGRNLGRVVITAAREEAHEVVATAVTLFAPDTVFVVTESFVFTHDTPDLSVLESGPPLRERFAAGDPNVAECLTVTQHWPDDTAMPAWLPYRYAGRSVEWLPPINREQLGLDTMFGPLNDAISDGFSTATIPAPVTTVVRQLERLGCTVELARTPPRAQSRNGPCACGSGRKYKHCHGR